MVAAEPSSVKTSDLGVRTASAVVMLGLAGAALWFGGLVWPIFAVVLMLGVLWEWRRLSAAITPSPAQRGLWNFAGIAYIGFATWVLIALRSQADGAVVVLEIVSAVVATDVGAYFAGRTFGGPKIAPRISPSKTWAGLIGGMIAAGLILAGWQFYFNYLMESRLQGYGAQGYGAVGAAPSPWAYVPAGALVAVIAQAGDFFESWMKRRAGVKDSSRFIPGHGGLFDRLDGLLAVSFVLGILLLLSGGFEAIA
jgi:phosphatidate cytidylyltransferase